MGFLEFKYLGSELCLHFFWTLLLFPLTLFFLDVTLFFLNTHSIRKLIWGEKTVLESYILGITPLSPFSPWVKVTKNGSSLIFLSVSPCQQRTLTFECRNMELGNNLILGTYGSDRSLFYF